MQEFNVSDKSHVLPIIMKYLVSNELYKTAKRLKMETELDLEGQGFPICEKKLEAIVGFYSEYWKALGEPGKRKGSIRKASAEIQNLTQLAEVEGEAASPPKETKKKDTPVAMNGKTKRTKIVKKVIKRIKKKKIVPKTKPKKVTAKLQTKTALTRPEPEPETKPKVKRKITKKEKQEKLETKRKKKQKNYQEFREESEANTLVNKDFQVRVNRGGTFTRCANVKTVKVGLFNSKWSNKVNKGGQDQFGLLGCERLGGTRGKNFRKEKTKLKNREFQGSKITFRNNLIDLD